MKTKAQFSISEIKLNYKSRVKASDRPGIKNSQDAFELFMESWDKNSIEHIEEFKILLLNRAHKVLGIATISSGGLTATVIDTRLILQYALKANATSIIACHNHPSGNLIPSEADIHITKKMWIAMEQLDISLLDHLILSPEEKFFSMADEGVI